MNPFSLLGVANNASITACQAAYRKLAMQYHPDRNKSPGAEEKFKQIKEAWEKIQGGFRIEAQSTSTPASSFTAPKGWHKPEDVGWVTRPFRPASSPKPYAPTPKAPKFPEFMENVIGSHYSGEIVQQKLNSYQKPQQKPSQKFYGDFIAKVNEEMMNEGFQVQIQIDTAWHVFNIPPNSAFDLQRKMPHADGYVTITPRRI